MEGPRLRAESELQPLDYTTATASWDLSCICNLCHSLWQHQILNPLSRARDRICILVGFVTSEPQGEFLKLVFYEVKESIPQTY